MALERSAVAVFAKRPLPGRAKTRLGRSLGVEVAASLASAFLTDSGVRFARYAETRPATSFCLFGDAPDAASFTASLESGACGSFEEREALEEAVTSESTLYFEQPEGHLGERMAAAVSALAGFSRFILLGADTPHLPWGRIDEAFRALEDHRVALGPSEDGGFYLLGARPSEAAGALSAIFSSDQWGDSGVLDRTRSALSGVSFKELASFEDFDEASDLVRWIRSVHSDRRESCDEAKPLASESKRPLSDREFEPTPRWTWEALGRIPELNRDLDR